MRPGFGFGLVVTLGAWLASCGSSLPPAPSGGVGAVRQGLASCAAAADCRPVGECETVSCTDHVCVAAPDGLCDCTAGGAAACDDGDPCTDDSCVLAGCVNSYAGGDTGGCCQDASDCPAPNACQEAPTCPLLGGACRVVAKAVTGCCNGPSDCGGGSATCVDNTCGCAGGQVYCAAQNRCLDAGACCTAADCDATRSTGAACSAGTCSYTGCQAGFADCSAAGANTDGCETAIDSSAANCGACGRACSTAHVSGSPVCLDGECVSACTTGFGNCGQPAAPAADDGCETALDTDAASCGACGRACSTVGLAGAPSCVGGLCTGTCASNRGNCAQPAAPAADDGCETALDTDADHCGACGRACSTSQTATLACSAGRCASSCAAGFGNCGMPAAPLADDGCEIATSSDVANCGACGFACPAPTNSCQKASCAGSSCGYTSTGAAGCCDVESDCAAPNACQTRSCVANRCVYAPKSVSGCCATAGDCPPPSSPCTVAVCLANTCQAMPIECADAGVDMAEPDLAPVDLASADLTAIDLAPGEDLAMPDLAMPDLAAPPDLGDGGAPDLAAPDLAMPDLATPDLAVAPDLAAPDLAAADLARAAPDLSPALSLTGGGGCATGGRSPSGGLLLALVGLCLLRALGRRRA